MALSFISIKESWLTGHRGRDDGHIYESILSLLICHCYSVSDSLEPLFKSIRKALVLVGFSQSRKRRTGMCKLPESWVLRLLVLVQ